MNQREQIKLKFKLSAVMLILQFRPHWRNFTNENLLTQSHPLKIRLP